MIAYSIIMFIIALIFAILGIEIRNGNTKLIHDYHQTNIKETELLQYGRSFSKGMFSLSAAMLLSGILSLLGRSIGCAIASVVVLIVGCVFSIIIFIKVQKKYNGGIF